MLRTALAILTCALLTSAAHAEAPKRMKAAVLPLKLQKGVDRTVGEAASEAFVVALQQLGLQVVTEKDIATALEFENKRTKLKVEVAKKLDADVCTDNTACLAEIGGALGVDLVVSGSMGRIGETVVVTVQAFDIRKAVVARRHQERRKGRSEEVFLEAA
ncbi:MAG: hypothetical protein ACK4N5_03355, partial [Myxococcales bacterium]